MTGAETVSDKLRRWADKSERRCMRPTTVAIEEVTGDHFRHIEDERELFRWLADEIEREAAAIAEAQHDSAHHIIKAYAESEGMPIRDGETITQWLDRWFVALPRYEDGTPVGFGDELELHRKGGGMDKGILQAIHVNKGTCWVLSFVGYNHERLYLYDSKTDVLRRAAQKVLDADGVEIKVGDTVWDIEGGGPWAVSDPCDNGWVALEDGSYASPSCLTHVEPAISADGKRLKEGMTVYVTPEHARDCDHGIDETDMAASLRGISYGMEAKVKGIKPSGLVRLVEYSAWCPASWLTTERPDTQERIDGDAGKSCGDYWGCDDATCGECPVTIDGKKPHERYGGVSCAIAQRLDLLRRQRELDAAMRGGAA